MIELISNVKTIQGVDT